VFQQFYLLVPQTGMTRVLILDLSGKILHEQTLSSGSMGTVSVEQFPPGLYIVNLQLPDGSVRSLRLVKK
jgi:hypothetical protein